MGWQISHFPYPISHIPWKRVTPKVKWIINRLDRLESVQWLLAWRPHKRWHYLTKLPCAMMWLRVNSRRYWRMTARMTRGTRYGDSVKSTPTHSWRKIVTQNTSAKFGRILPRTPRCAPHRSELLAHTHSRPDFWGVVFPEENWRQEKINGWWLWGSALTDRQTLFGNCRRQIARHCRHRHIGHGSARRGHEGRYSERQLRRSREHRCRRLVGISQRDDGFWIGIGNWK